MKHLTGSGKIAGTVHKTPLTPACVQLLFEKGELACAGTNNPRALMQTVWFYVSLYFGKRGHENQNRCSVCAKSSGEKYYDLNKEDPGAMLSKNHSGVLYGTEDHSDDKLKLNIYCLLQPPSSTLLLY